MAYYFVELPFGARFFLKVDGIEVLDDVEALQKALSDLRPVWKKAANITRRSFAENFRMGGRPKWAPLKAGTIMGKQFNEAFTYASMRARARISRLQQMRNGRMQRSATNILIVSGALRDSYVQKGANHIERISKKGLESGSDHYLAPFHEYGTGEKGPEGKSFVIVPKRAQALRWFGGGGNPIFAKKVINPGVPPRPVAIIQDEDEQAVIDALQEHLGASAVRYLPATLPEASL